MPMKPKELRDNIKGVIHLVISNFDDKDRLDEKAIKKSVNQVAEWLEGQDAVFLTTASTAEFYSLTDDECKTIISTVVKEVAGRFPVIAGTGRAGTKPAVEMSQYAQKAGADGVMLVNPYYLPPTTEGVFRHFKEIADSIHIGIMIYNNPVATKLWIPPDLMARLSKVENIVADKENTANAVAYYWMQRAVHPDDMVIVCGIGQLMYPFSALFGCRGFVTELANFAPDIAVGFYKAAQKRDFDTLTELADRLAPYHQFISQLGKKRGASPSILSPYVSGRELPFYVSVIKEAMSLKGLPGGPVREPMENLTADEKEQLRKILQQIGVL
jgi:4-hydroxy-tetrahydrodipicolinate synthase